MKGGNNGIRCWWLAAMLLWFCKFTCREGGLLTSEAACIPSTGCDHALAYYTVHTGTTVSTLMQNFQISTADLQAYNKNVTDINVIKAGDKLYIPFSCTCTNDHLIKQFVYTVVQSDTLESIVSGVYENLTTVDAVSTASNLENPNDIIAGNNLGIPVKCFCGDPSINSSYGLFTTYVVQAGDQLSSLATIFGVSVDVISRFNAGVQNLQANSIIFIPTRDGNGVFPAFNNTGSTSHVVSSKSNIGIIVGVVVGGLFLVAVALFAALLGRNYFLKVKVAKKDEKQQSALLPMSSTNMAESDRGSRSASSMLADLKSVEFSYEELAGATNDFNLSHKIGQGGFASVYYGVIREQKLAIKKMNLQATKEFLAELQVLTNVHHTNLVQLIGYCTTNSLFLVYEYIENGTLDQHLRCKYSNDMPVLTWAQRVQISLDAARGLEYIHEHTKPTYIHRDIKSANILIDKNFHAKVADFGLAKLTEDGIGTGIVGTFGYMSPEYALYGEVSPKLDVYAFGVVLFEILSGRIAIATPNLTDFSDLSPAPVGEGRTLTSLFDPILRDPDGKSQLHKYVDPALNSDYPVDAAWKMALLARRCTDSVPDLRPNMRFAVVQLMTLASSTQEWDIDYVSRGSSQSGQGSGR